MAENITFFKFRPEDGKTYVVPNTTDTDTFTFSSEWAQTPVQGGTEAVTAFSYTNNPSIPINLKFHEDMWRDYAKKLPSGSSYESTVAGLASLQYPVVSGNKIKPPYCKIDFNGYVLRGYFNNVRITQSGPIRNGHKTFCEFAGQFVIVKSSTPNRSGVASSFKTYFS